MGERFTNANLFNAFVREAVAQGLREKLVAASPELRAVVESPPLQTAMVPGRVCDTLYQAVVDARGRPALRRLAYAGMRDHGGPLLKGLFENTRALFGDSPDALFAQTQTIIGPIIRNIEVTWAFEPPRAGVLTIRPEGAPAPLSFAIWEGYFEYFFDLCGVQGTVEEARLSEENRAALIRVHW